MESTTEVISKGHEEPRTLSPLARGLGGRVLQRRVAPRIVRIYTLRGFESVLAGSVQISTGTKTSLSFQDGPVFTRVHRREGPAAPRSLLASDPRARPRLQDRVHPRLPEPAGASHADPTRAPLKGEQLQFLGVPPRRERLQPTGRN